MACYWPTSARLSQMSDTPVRAACLTPPAVGGVAVVQVVGAAAGDVVSRHLRSKQPIDFHSLDPSQLRLCQFHDEQEIIDDVLVCARWTADGQQVIDLNLHGGPRIVQRVLLALKRS